MMEYVVFLKNIADFLTNNNRLKITSDAAG